MLNNIHGCFDDDTGLYCELATPLDFCGMWCFECLIRLRHSTSVLSNISIRKHGQPLVRGPAAQHCHKRPAGGPVSREAEIDFCRVS